MAEETEQVQEAGQPMREFRRATFKPTPKYVALCSGLAIGSGIAMWYVPKQATGIDEDP
jgi:hypothetical protein